MDTFFILAVLIGILVGVLLAAIVVLILHLRNSSQLNRLTYPAYEYAVKKAQHEADALIKVAQEKAREIIAKAEEAGQESIKEYDEAANQMQIKYREALAAQSTELLKRFEQATNEQTQTLRDASQNMQESFASEHKKVIHNVTSINDSLAAMATKAEQHTKNVVATLETKINTVSKEIEDSLRGAEEKGLSELSGHFESMKEALEKEVRTYGDSRKQLLDAHVERLVEDVVKNILHTTLPASTHASLARQALEEAKAKHIL